MMSKNTTSIIGVMFADAVVRPESLMVLIFNASPLVALALSLEE